MSARDLTVEPVWRGEELGLPLPDSIHAVSVSLPRWEDIIGYEEKKPEVISRLQSGYPRFCIHSMVKEVARSLGGSDSCCLPFPSAKAAALAVDFIQRFSGEKAWIASGSEPLEIHLVQTTPAGEESLQAFWRHTGLIISSRRAQAFLEKGERLVGESSAHESLRKHLAGFYNCSEGDVFLAPSGMAALFAAWRGVTERRKGLPTVQLGFPYVDTFKLQQKFGTGALLLHDLESVGEDLLQVIGKQPQAACFCEIPGNPMLGSADLRTITPALRAHGIPLVVDDTVATHFNVDLSSHADLIATSLTKYIAGTGDVMGGALICNPKSPLYQELKSILSAQHEELLWAGDAAVIDAQIHSFPERMERHNANGLFLAERLREHPAVERVWYPKWDFKEAYEAVRRPGGGWGSVIAFLPKNAAENAPRIYDTLALCKGPSLGTCFTLACPFTLLAHYTELEWADQCGIPSHLIRLSAGIEEPQEIWGKLEKALGAVR